ncbi:MAG: zinc-dependent metalloprotease, partial [Actinomycetota bacterium]|nr:zinc-dependent metalloprotease [Actinomycetota bacterium]
GLAGLLGGEHDPDKLVPIQALVANIEGYGDYVVRLALAEVAPDLDRIEEAWRSRRAEPNQAEEFLSQLIGLKLERRHAGDAARLFAEIERRWAAIDRVWSSPDSVPTLAELTDPVGWAARVLLTDSLEEPE